MKKQLFYLLLAAGVLSACGPAVPQLGKDSVEDVIGAMTLEEKARLVIGTGIDRKSTRLNSSHNNQSRMPSSA